MLGFKLNGFRVGCHPKARLANDTDGSRVPYPGPIAGRLFCRCRDRDRHESASPFPFLWFGQTLVLVVRQWLLVS
jgi:hypothetical protein